MYWLAGAIVFLGVVLMHKWDIRLFYMGTDEKKYEQALFGVLLMKK